MKSAGVAKVVEEDDYLKQAENISADSEPYNYQHYYDKDLSLFSRLIYGAIGGSVWAAFPFYEYMTKEGQIGGLYVGILVIILSSVVSLLFGGQSKSRSILLGLLAPFAAALLVGILK